MFKTMAPSWTTAISVRWTRPDCPTTPSAQFGRAVLGAKVPGGSSPWSSRAPPPPLDGSTDPDKQLPEESSLVHVEDFVCGELPEQGPENLSLPLKKGLRIHRSSFALHSLERDAVALFEIVQPAFSLIRSPPTCRFCPLVCFSYMSTPTSSFGSPPAGNNEHRTAHGHTATALGLKAEHQLCQRLVRWFY
ncbi:hypothetical protein FHG87_023524 [Trinorchestia longiramus]|nr:hypothetical protein FHG87_023524 [Trinorchestia longiramus]